MPNDLATFPQSISVTFPAAGTGTPVTGWYTISISLVSLALQQFLNITGSPWAHLLHRYEKANYTQGAASATIGAGGAGYTNGDTLTLSGGTFTSAATFTATVAGGVVTAVTLATAGTYSSLPANPVSTTGGTGSGCTLNVSWSAGSLVNGSALTTLATQVATDWYLWQLAGLDQYFTGVATWVPEGLQELEWRQQSGRITTHVQRRHFNPQEDLVQVPSAAAGTGAIGPAGPAGPAGAQGTILPLLNEEEPDPFLFVTPPDWPQLARQTTLASAATTDLGGAGGMYVNVTGTTTITAFGTVPDGMLKVVRFTGVLTLTHNSTSLILQGGVNKTTAANDVAMFVSLGGGNWREVNYFPPPGAAGKVTVTSYGVPGTYTFSKNGATTRIRVTVIGGGGGGAGAAGGVGQSGAGGGGGGGGAVIHEDNASAFNVNETAVVGGGGLAGGNTGTNGGNGGNSTFTVTNSVLTLTGGGGVGGLGSTAGTSTGVTAVGGVGGAGLNGNIANINGTDGGPGMRWDGTNALSGYGGGSLYAGTVQGVAAPSAGNASYINGGGGSGGASQGAGGAVGVVGQPGLIIVEEFS